VSICNAMHSRKSCIIKISVAGHRLIKVNENHYYPSDDAEIDGDDRSTPAKGKLVQILWLH
jgi:hypothetical protein